MSYLHFHRLRCRFTREHFSDALDLGPHSAQFFFDPLVAAVDVVNAVNDGLTVSNECSDDQRCRSAQVGCEHGGAIPPTPLYTWRNLPLDVGHVLTYFVAHEGHHRGQIVMAARALGARLPAEVTEGLWAWNRRSAEAGTTR